MFARRLPLPSRPTHRFRTGLLVCVWLVALVTASAKSLRVFVIGNSFSGNATRYLPELAKAGGHELVLGKAQAGGCSFARHWDALAADLASPGDPKGKIYAEGKSLREHMGEGRWDIITTQQYSRLSGDPASYRPFAAQLYAYLKKVQPDAEIVLHQTWAYRSDAKSFGEIGDKKQAANSEEMWRRSRAAYHQIAREQNVRVIPTGDAFWRVATDPTWTYVPDTTFDYQNPVTPQLPVQKNSLHVGYRWGKDGKFGIDPNHANPAGEYLGALVWYGFLFDETPEKLTFVPDGIDPVFAAFLRKTAWDVVHQAKAEKPTVADVSSQASVLP